MSNLKKSKSSKKEVTTTKAAFQKLDDYEHLDDDIIHDINDMMISHDKSKEKPDVSKMKVEIDKITSNANKMNELMQPQSSKNKSKLELKILYLINLKDFKR
jgi:hypothetical protein